MEAFILKVREYPCLWNSELDEYKDTDAKESAWLDIAKAFPQFKDPRQAKYQWKKLRDNHREAIKRKMIGRRGSSAQYGHIWKHEKVMEFILPFMNNRLMRPSVDVHLSNADDPSNENEDDDSRDHCLEGDTKINVTFPFNNIETELPETTAAMSIPEDTFMSSLDKKLEKRKRKSNSNEGHKKDKSKFNPLDYFFASMCETTKRLPEHIQLKIKRKLFQAVMEGEERKIKKGKRKSTGTNRRAKNARSSVSSLSESMAASDSNS